MRAFDAELGRTDHPAITAIRSALAEAFTRRGFEIALVPGGDVLKISPALKDLYVNAPEGSSTGMVRSYAREAGQARMVVEGNDAAAIAHFVGSSNTLPLSAGKRWSYASAAVAANTP